MQEPPHPGFMPAQPKPLRALISRLIFGMAVFGALSSTGLAVPVAPSNLEQYMLELINRARANPAAEAARFGIDLNEAPENVELNISPVPKQPVAFNFYLNDSAEDYSQWMIDNDKFLHEGYGSKPAQRAITAGYNPGGVFMLGENLAWKGQTGTLPNPVNLTTELHAGLFVDEGIDDRGHRTNMLKPNHMEIGIGIVSGVFTKDGSNYNAVMITTDFAYLRDSVPNPFLTGVIYRDDDSNQFYSPTGEGYGDIAIRAWNTTTGVLYETTSFSTGGYTLQVPAGTYNLTMGGSNLLNTTFLGVAIGSQNVKVDLVDSPDLRPWSNPLNPFDANGNGTLEPHDVLVLIDELNRNGARALSTPPGGVPSLYVDVNRDALFSPADILGVIDAINRSSQQALAGGNLSGGVLSYFERSELASVPEPSGFAITSIGFGLWLTLRRLRGRLPK